MQIFDNMTSFQTPIDEKIFDIYDINVRRQPSETEYKCLIGAVIYCLPTQPGIAFAINLLASRAPTHTISDYVRLLRLVKYLQKDTERGIHIRWSRNFELNTFCDANWLLDTQNSTSYYCSIIRLGENILVMNSKKIKGVMTSSTEAEQFSIFELAKSIEYWRFYLSEIQHKMRKPTIIYQDNASAIIISNTLDKNFKKVKYFLMRINKVNNLVQQDVIELIWLETLNQLADIGTKPTTPKRFNYLDERLRGVVKMLLSAPMDLEDFGVSKV
jgi:hypothetical protein